MSRARGREAHMRGRGGDPNRGESGAPRLDAANLAGITALMNTQHIKPGINLDMAEKAVMGKPTVRTPASADPVAQYTKELAQLADDLGIDLVSDNPAVGGAREVKAPRHETHTRSAEVPEEDKKPKKSAPSSSAALGSLDELFEDLGLDDKKNSASASETRRRRSVDERSRRSHRSSRSAHKKPVPPPRTKLEKLRDAPRKDDKRVPDRRDRDVQKLDKRGGREKQERRNRESKRDDRSVSGSEASYTGSEGSYTGSDYTDESGEGDYTDGSYDEGDEGDEGDSEESIDGDQVLADLDRDLGISSGEDRHRRHKKERPPKMPAIPERSASKREDVTDEQENRNNINAVFSDLRKETTTTFSAESARTEDLKANKLEQIGQLRMVLEDEGVDTSAIENPKPEDSMEKIDGVLNTLKLKNDRNRYSSLAEEVILGAAEGIESVFDGTRSIPVLGWKPDYTGYPSTVNCKLHRMRFETSQIVGQIIERHRIGPTARIIMELLPSFFLYPRQQRRQRGAPGLANDPKVAAESRAVVGDPRSAYAAIRAADQNAISEL